jgi:integrase
MASIRKRGDTFTITAYMGYDDKGKQIRKTTTFTPPADVTAGKAEKLAKEYATVWEHNIRGYIHLDENRTFIELAEWYFKVISPTIHKQNMLENKQMLLRAYVYGKIGNIKLKHITPQILDNMFTELRNNGRCRQLYRLKDTTLLNGIKMKLENNGVVCCETASNLSRGKNAVKDACERIADYLGYRFDDIFEYGIDNRELSPNTVSRIRAVLSSMFNTAVRKEIITRNPVSKTTPINVPQRAASYLDDKQVSVLLNALEESEFQFRVIITLLIYTGMRGGEVCGLTWDNIDFENGLIFVNKTLIYTPGRKEKSYSLQSPKTITSERYIAIPQHLIDLLREHKRRQDEQKALIGNTGEFPDMVFTARAGGIYYAEQNLNLQFKNFIKKIGLPPELHIHSLRHTNASLLINADIPARVVSEQLGHANTSITQDLYSHVFASSKAKAMQALEMKIASIKNQN